MTFSSFTETLTFRFIAVLILIIGLTIPTVLVSVIVSERMAYQQNVALEISRDWGSTAVVTGPFLALTKSEKSSSNSANPIVGNVSSSQTTYYSPIEFKANVTSEHEIRSRGIFTAPVYTAHYELKGNFQGIQTKQPSNDGDTTVMSACNLVFLVNDTRSIRSATVDYDGNNLPLDVGALDNHSIGLKANIPVDDCAASTYSISLKLLGSRRQLISLIGATSSVEVRSSWPHPKFVGRSLPDSHTITESGFVAEWNSIALASGFPMSFDETNLTNFRNGSEVGFEFFEPASFYQKVSRAVKYGFLAIGLTMMAIFCADLIANARFHLIQYAVVGAGLALFFLLLLALAEHLGYLGGYLVAAGTLTTLITGYTWFSLRKQSLSWIVGLLMVGIYTALYLCISSADYALLIGAGLLVILLIGLMYATRGLAGTTITDETTN